MHLRNILAATLLSGACLIMAGSRPADILFEKHTLDLGANESAAVMDINGDGRLDTRNSAANANCWKRWVGKPPTFI